VRPAHISEEPCGVDPVKIMGAWKLQEGKT